MLEERKTKRGTVYYAIGDVTVAVKCSRCGEVLPATNFHGNNSSQAGYSNVCIPCKNKPKNEEVKNGEEVKEIKKPKNNSDIEQVKNNKATETFDTDSLFSDKKVKSSVTYSVHEVAEAFGITGVNLFKYLRKIGWCHEVSPTEAGLELGYVAQGAWVIIEAKNVKYRKTRITTLGIERLFELSLSDCERLGITLKGVYEQLPNETGEL